ncbi:hypothetical protein BT63DRAFT_133750 [Microthyrium microscopicum]|uniref:Fe2OG dioxygenase domain-containing protein n=1 Tax=Microthyrium microscopicum TaxID=703497 RepID=A0A6A6UML7_9PEZI|nr:hypothetical protein BT63DRAFT_133750 [Microthyrium microscopicum]
MAPKLLKANSKAESSIASKTKDETVAWPKLQPIIPSTSLELTEILPDQIFTISNLWSTKLCKQYVSFLSSLPLMTTPGRPKKGEAVRVNDRFQIDDPGFADRLWNETALQELVTGNASGMSKEQQQAVWGGLVVGLNPNIRVYRYTKGQFFGQHYDDSNIVTIGTTRGHTTWTLLLYLTSPATGCTGGQTVFYPEADEPKKGTKTKIQPQPITVELEVGMALLHKHGSDCLLHEGLEVTSGEKWIIRSDLVVI